MFTSDKNPTVSAVYLIDRDKQGKYYRWFNEETGVWGNCAADIKEAYSLKDTKSSVGFFPWIGPLTGPKFNREVVDVVPVHKIKSKVKPIKPVEPVQPIKPVKPVKAKKTTKQPGYVNGTVFFRADRNKWVAVWNGKQEAARPTREGCLAFLKKKYDFIGNVIE
jgi:hypothetical protein